MLVNSFTFAKLIWYLLWVLYSFSLFSLVEQQSPPRDPHVIAVEEKTTVPKQNKKRQTGEKETVQLSPVHHKSKCNSYLKQKCLYLHDSQHWSVCWSCVHWQHKRAIPRKTLREKYWNFVGCSCSWNRPFSHWPKNQLKPANIQLLLKMGFKQLCGTYRYLSAASQTGSDVNVAPAEHLHDDTGVNSSNTHQQ